MLVYWQPGRVGDDGGGGGGGGGGGRWSLDILPQDSFSNFPIGKTLEIGKMVFSNPNHGWKKLEKRWKLEIGKIEMLVCYRTQLEIGFWKIGFLRHILSFHPGQEYVSYFYQTKFA